MSKSLRITLMSLCFCIPFLSNELKATHDVAAVSDIDHVGMGTFSGFYTHSATDHVWIVFNANAGDVVTVGVSTPAWRSYFWIYQSNTGCIQVGNSIDNGCMVLVQENGPFNGSGSFTFTAPTTTQYAIQLDAYVGESGNYTLNVSGSSATSALCTPAAPVFTACPSSFTTSLVSGTCCKPVTYNAVATYGVLTYTMTGATVGSGDGTGSGNCFNKGATVVTVTSTSPCGGATATCTFTVTVNDDNIYTMLAYYDIHLHYNTVYGNVGVWGANKKARIEEQTNVIGSVRAPIIELVNSSTISGAQITSQAPAPPNNFRYNTRPDTASDINVPDNYTGVYNLSGNVFKKIEVGKNSILNFTSSGDIYVREFKTKEGANTRFSGNTNLIIKKKLELYKLNKFNQTGSNTVNVFVEDYDVKIGYGSYVTANIDDRFSKLEVDGKSDLPTFMTGNFIAYKIEGKDYITWNSVCQGPSARSIGAPGLASVSYQFDATVYPNPTKGDFNIMVNSSSDAPIRATVYDIMGRVIEDNNNLKANVVIPVSKTLSNGMYLIRIDQNGVSKTMHLVKE